MMMPELPEAVATITTRTTYNSKTWNQPNFTGTKKRF
jgi:hypothetical protein